MRRFTERKQKITIFTLSSLRKHLQQLQVAEKTEFSIDKLHNGHMTVRAKTPRSGSEAWLILPTYPTGHPDDAPWNPNVVLDPLGFIEADTPEERAVFTPLLGPDVLEFYERLHQNSESSLLRCC